MIVEHLHRRPRPRSLLGRPVKWTETRSENMVAMWHGRGHVHYVELGLKRDGTITGLRVRTLADAGAYPAVGAFLPFFTQMMSQNVYVIPKVEFNWQAAVTNTTPVAAYRGAGRPEAIHLVERILDIAADELGIDPVEIRRKNFIPPDAFPYTPITGLGATYDSGEYDKALDAALEHAGYDALRAEQTARRERGDTQAARHRRRVVPRDQRADGVHRGVRLGRDRGRRHGDRARRHERARPGSRDHVLADHQRRARRPDRERARRALRHRRGVARRRHRRVALAARSAAARCSGASEEVLAQAKQLAAHLLEANPDDIVVGDGGLEVAGVPASKLSWAELARRGEGSGASRPDRLAERLQHELDFAVRRLVVPVRFAHRGGRDRRRHRPRRAAAAHRGRRLRQDRQPVARRRPAARRHRAGRRAGAVRRGAVRRRRQPDHREPHGLRDAVGRGAAVVRDVQHRDAEPAQPARREGHRRVGDARLDARGAQRDRRRALAPRRPPHRHAVHGRAGVARAAEDDGCAVRTNRRCGSPSRSTRRSSAIATTACPTRRADCSLGPLGADGEPTGAVTEARPCRNADASARHVHGRPARHARARCAPPRRAATRSSACGTRHTHTDAVPVAHRRAPGRRPRVVVRDRVSLARPDARCCARTASATARSPRSPSSSTADSSRTSSRAIDCREVPDPDR